MRQLITKDRDVVRPIIIRGLFGIKSYYSHGPSGNYLSAVSGTGKYGKMSTNVLIKMTPILKKERWLYSSITSKFVKSVNPGPHDPKCPAGTVAAIRSYNQTSSSCFDKAKKLQLFPENCDRSLPPVPA